MCLTEAFKDFFKAERQLLKRYLLWKFGSISLYLIITFCCFSGKNWKGYLLAIIMGFLLATFRTVYRTISRYYYLFIKQKEIDCPEQQSGLQREFKSIKSGLNKPHRDFLFSYLINYPLTFATILILGTGLLEVRYNFYFRWIFFILGFGADSIFYLLTQPGDLFNKLK